MFHKTYPGKLNLQRNETAIQAPHIPARLKVEQQIARPQID